MFILTGACYFSVIKFQFFIDSNNDDFILESSNNDISQNDTGTDSSVFSYRSLKAVKVCKMYTVTLFIV